MVGAGLGSVVMLKFGATVTDIFLAVGHANLSWRWAPGGCGRAAARHG